VFLIIGKLLLNTSFTFNRLLHPLISALTILFGNFALWLLNNGDWNLLQHVHEMAIVPSARSPHWVMSASGTHTLADANTIDWVSCKGMNPAAVFSRQTKFCSLSEYLNNAGYCPAAVPWNRLFLLHRNIKTGKQTPTQWVSDDFSPSETLQWPVHAVTSCLLPTFRMSGAKPPLRHIHICGAQGLQILAYWGMLETCQNISRSTETSFSSVRVDTQ